MARNGAIYCRMETKEMVSLITIRFLEQGCTELQQLAEVAQLNDPDA